MDKYFDINESGCSVRCKLYCEQPKALRHVVIFCHGFGGHKDNRAAERFARFAMAKYPGTAVLTFDWPCHGADGRKKLSLADCDAYLSLVIAYARERLGAQDVSAYATSFGGYLLLKYLSEHGNPFRRVALRCPAVQMYDVLCRSIMTEENREKLARGKDVLVGFDRKIKLGADFLEELRREDITGRDFLPYADELLILHGTKDEIVPIEGVRAFAEQNVIEFIPVENADHRFMDPQIMEKAIVRIAEFLLKD